MKDEKRMAASGFAASPNSRGSACYCVNLFSGKSTRFERSDVLGGWTGNNCRNGREMRWSCSSSSRRSNE